jgi:hypothetical protein
VEEFGAMNYSTAALFDEARAPRFARPRRAAKGGTRIHFSAYLLGKMDIRAGLFDGLEH